MIELWRMDENGNQSKMKTWKDKDEARAKAVLEALMLISAEVFQHKQTYWLKRTEGPNGLRDPT